MSISLAFSLGKPCCNKKAGKNTVSCKFNHDASETEKDIFGKLQAENAESSSKAYKCNSADGSKCAKSGAKKPWWKFWAKKSTKSCPCKKADATQTVSAG